MLVGGGDPYLASKPAAKDEPAYPARADLRTLARLTAAALADQGIRRAALGYDDTLFTGPDVNPHWEPSYVPDGVVSPITALWADEGRPASGQRTGAGPVADRGDVLRPGAARGRRPGDRPARYGAARPAAPRRSPRSRVRPSRRSSSGC